MTHTVLTPKKRIDSIDAIRGFAILGILVWHCMERFDLVGSPVVESPFWQAFDTGVLETLRFLFQGKAYAIFSLLFGLSFFMQMDSQAEKGNDFRLRFLWRMTILFVLGYINGLFYMGEFFMVYAILGLFLIPLFRVGTKWLVAIAVLLFLQIPGIVSFVSLLVSNTPNEPTYLVSYMDSLFGKAADIFTNGSFADVIRFNTFEGQLAKLLWVFNNFRYLQLIGLFIVGMLIGRYHIHKDPEKMVRYSKKVLPWAAVWFAVFYGIVLLLPTFGVEGFALEVGKTLFNGYASLGLMMIYICGLTLLYYRRKGAQKLLDRIAPVGRMSVTNYMMQSLFGITLFYGFGLGLAGSMSYAWTLVVALGLCCVQIAYSNWWMKRFYYGPMEGLWRTITWMTPIKMHRK